jgi:hypothetical protein
MKNITFDEAKSDIIKIYKNFILWIIKYKKYFNNFD